MPCLCVLQHGNNNTGFEVEILSPQSPLSAQNKSGRSRVMFVARKERTEPHGANESCHGRTTGIRSFLRKNAQNPGKKKMNKIMPFLNQIYPLNSYKKCRLL
jgi:hypothetical protein